jgi:acyl-homoserine-lactone acylase
MNKLFLTLLFGLTTLGVVSQNKIDASKIDIVRDTFGVPHIFAKTDPEVAYGLAWAHAEDDFETIQKGFLASKSMLAAYAGKDGATIDYIIRLLRCRELVDSLYEKDISPAYKALLQGYCDGFNAYAKAHKKEVLLTKSLPATPKDMLTYSVLQLGISCGVDGALQRIFNGTIPLANFIPSGSNGFAFNSKITTDGNVYLAINSHQPLEGPVSWYEAHLCSEEGWNILGAFFPGSPTVLIGANEYLGWTHTVNYPDKLDVYQLQMNPANKLQYKFDDTWKSLTETKVKLKVKLAGVRIPVKRKAYQSLYGPTMITKKGVFSIRTGGLMDIRALEQWYRMNKAKNFYEFKNALKMEAIPGYNIVYGDRYDTIYYLSNGKIPLRPAGYNWRSTLPGNTSKTLWSKFHPLRDLPQVLNPTSGYVFNNNHTPFNATAAKDNIKNGDYDPTMGFETNDNNRSLRVMELMKQYSKISYDDFKRIKYNLQLPQKLAYKSNVDTLFLLREDDYPEVAGLIKTLKDWDRKATMDSKGAAVFGVLYYYIVGKLESDASYKVLTKKKCIEALTYIKAYLFNNFGTTDVTLGDYQRLVRGNKSIPLPGLPDVIASMLSVPFEKGRVKGNQGESYIELVKFTRNGPEIESINCYGASNKKGNPHYDDQMELFQRQKTRKMTLNKEQVYKEAKSIYHPQ